MALEPDFTTRTGLFSPNVAVVETTTASADDSWLFPDEQHGVVNAVAKRRAEFARGRRCARLAMEQLGASAAPVRRGDKGEPLWPEGLVGSITHTDGFAAAAVGRSDEVAGLGLDVEVNAPLPDGTERLILRPEEAERIAADRSGGPLHVDRLVFCAKEATYKVWFPIAGRWLDFMDASVHIEPNSPDAGSFDVEVLVDGPIRHLTGRYLIDGSYLLAAIELGAG